MWCRALKMFVMLVLVLANIAMAPVDCCAGEHHEDAPISQSHHCATHCCHTPHVGPLNASGITLPVPCMTTRAVSLNSLAVLAAPFIDGLYRPPIA